MRLEKIRVKDIMHDVTTVPIEASITEAAKIMNRKLIGSILAVKEGEPVGMLTERDILRKVVAKGKDPKTTSIYEIMTSPLITTHKDTTLSDALKIFRKHYIRRLLITDDDGKIIGIITHRNVVLSVPTTYFAKQRARRSLLSAETMV